MIGVMLMVSVALIIVASIAYGILASRKSYFEQRNLRELDRIAAELNTTREGLAQAVTLHFVRSRSISRCRPRWNAWWRPRSSGAGARR